MQKKKIILEIIEKVVEKYGFVYNEKIWLCRYKKIRLVCGEARGVALRDDIRNRIS